MISRKAFSESMALLLATFPDRAPRDEAKFVMEVWYKAFSDLTDEELRQAVTKAVMGRTKLFPGDNMIAVIRELARPVPTEGDALELLGEAVSRFGRYRPDEALAWLEAQAPLVAAAVRRFGFLEWCDSENQEVARGQFRSVFNQERERASRDGAVAPTAIGMNDILKLAPPDPLFGGPGGPATPQAGETPRGGQPRRLAGLLGPSLDPKKGGPQGGK